MNQMVRVLDKYNQSPGMVRYGRCQFKSIARMPLGNQTAEILKTRIGFHQTDGTIFREGIGQFRPYNRCDIRLLTGTQKRPQSIKVVRIRKGQAIVTQLLGRPANPFRGRRTPHQ